MDYSPDILERIDTLSRKCFDKKKVITDYIGILQTRAELEEYYSRNLEKIAESLTKLIHGKDALKDVFLTLRNYIQIQSEQSRGFARQIKNDVVAEISALLLQEQNWQKDMSNFAKKHQKEIKINIDKLNQLRDEYIIAIQEEQRIKQNPNQKPRFLKPRNLCETHLREFIDKYNQYIEVYFSDIATVQTTFQNIELERRKTIQASAMKYLVFEISLIRNLQYDISSITQKIEQYNYKQDISELFKEPPSNKPLLTKLNFDNYRKFLNQQINYNPPQNTSENKHTPRQGNKIFDPIPQEKQRKRQIFSNIDNAVGQKKPVENDQTNQLQLKLFQTAFFENIISDQAIDNLRSTLDDITIIQMPYSLERILSLSLHTEAQQSERVKVGPQGYVSLMKILSVFYDYCDKKNNFGDSVIKMSNLIKTMFKQVQMPEEQLQQEQQQSDGCEIALFDGFTSHEVFRNYELWMNYAKNSMDERQKMFLKEQEVAVFTENFIEEDDQIKNNIRIILKELAQLGIVDALRLQISKELCEFYQVQELKIASSSQKASQKELEDVFQ